MQQFHDFYQHSIDPQQRDQFWLEQAALVDWHQKPQQICDYSQPKLYLRAVACRGAAHGCGIAVIWRG